MRKIAFIISWIFCVACTSVSSKGEKKTDAKSFLSGLSSEDKFLLEYFFRCLVQEDAIGYSLIHEKPMGFFSYLHPKSISTPSNEIQPISRIHCFIEGFDPRHVLFQKGFEIWEKHKNSFCKKNLYFDFFSSEGVFSHRKVIVINKKLILPLLDKHKKEIQKLAPSLNNPDSIFRALLNDEKFKQKFYASTMLTGICLGYGERNAKLFNKMVHYLDVLGVYGFSLYSLSFQNKIEEKLKALKASTSIFGSQVSKKMRFSFGSSFRADFADAETQFLMEKYRNASKKLSQKYSNPNTFLENTLNLLLEADEL